MFGQSPLLDQTVQHIARHLGEDDRGNDAWIEDDPVDVPHCSVQPLDSTEYLTSASDQIVSRWQFFGPPDMGLEPTDLIEADGQRYEVDGKPGLNHAVSSFLVHTSAVLKEYTG
ncbi:MULTISPECIES: hypothetical protein [unclassified Streptomyces]|uniref:hypothetical protein n=1 Tax=unclassified Streptomyces TaxID=2593676 RepID=UPI001F48E398|nr:MULTISPECIES: hypothetical protein [unclassified Streptomyces]MCF0087162.1 hypothetical protein [Streptomyces sp. MH192]MCF0099000.1 hypothetical protein [Streptomyces sp. MH191]